MITFMAFQAMAQEQIALYEGAVINSRQAPDEETVSHRDGITIISKISRPSLTVFLPERTTEDMAAVIICPGGGYHINAFEHEGTDVAKEFNKHGVAAFVLKYRIPDKATMTEPEKGPIQDLQQAIKIVRENSKKWRTDPRKTGIMGFSAGGHLASTAATHFTTSFIENKSHTSLRPDFAILIYPVISFSDAVGHIGSRDQLLGKDASKEKIEYFSSELHVNENTPPSFLVHAGDDGGVNVENSILFYKNLKRNNVKAELHIYQNGGHGFGLNNKTTTDKWMDRCIAWMISNKWISSSE